LTRDGTYTYTWDAVGRLITVTDGITTLGFLYDGDGNRLARSVNGTLTTHTLDVGLSLPEVLVEHDEGDVTRYLHLPTGVATDDGAWTYSAADGLGSVRQRLDASGQVAAVNGYRPFGSPLEGDGGEPYGFTGEWWEADLNLLYLRARWYAPSQGRF
jgi:YD repeat-containing protein